MQVKVYDELEESNNLKERGGDKSSLLLRWRRVEQSLRT